MCQRCEKIKAFIQLVEDDFSFELAMDLLSTIIIRKVLQANPDFAGNIVITSDAVDPELINKFKNFNSNTMH